MSTFTLTQLEPSKKRGASISNATSGKKRKISEQHHSQLVFHPAAPTKTTATLLNPPSAPPCNNTTVSHEPGQINARSVTADDVSEAFDLSPSHHKTRVANGISLDRGLSTPRSPRPQLAQEPTNSYRYTTAIRVLLELDVLGSAIRKILITVDEMEKTARKTDDPALRFAKIIMRLKENCLELLRVQQEKLADLDQGSLI
ncbi:hypothetical protein BKA59DRAFT_461327 [Fusarium tricinctum]|uniref:Uncharacterized protein n=1 Tax=Fusarium tricinctum TaxID=61284 RepID=A0A8K0RNA3_9HYPO|nr:hypothetical protein BKA59DRAFT_461327 [Fusarium tricinctum]